MNERILEILKQSGGVAYDDDGNRLLDMLVGPEIEKFAKLIIQECMDNLAWHGHDDAVSQLEYLKINKLGIK